MKADSAAALGAAHKLASPTPTMNFLGAELSLFLEREDLADPSGEHLPGKLNKCADYLSRVMTSDVPPMPSSLIGVKVRRLTKRRKFALTGFGPGPRPDLWGRQASLEEAEERGDFSTEVVRTDTPIEFGSFQ